MERLRQSLVLLLVAGIPAAAPPLDVVAPDLCFASGSVTYRLARTATAPDYRVRIDDAAPDVRVALVDRPEIADFALADDGGQVGDACRSAGFVKTVAIVPAGKPSDVSLSLSRDEHDADFTLYVHSARVTHQDAAALFALMRHMANLANADQLASR